MTQHSSSQPGNLNLPSSQESVSGSTLLRHLLIGSAEGVTLTIQRLHCLGYAEVGDWSPLLPASNAGEVMSIMTRTGHNSGKIAGPVRPPAQDPQPGR